jgi:hypothetical protein
MKQQLLVMMLCLAGAAAFAQPSISFEKKEMTIIRSAEFGKTVDINLIATAIPPDANMPVTVAIASNDSPFDYDLLNNKLFFTENMTGGHVVFNVKSGKPLTDTDHVSLTFTDPYTKKARSLSLLIVEEAQDKPASLLNKVMYLNAYNFDLGEVKLSSNYVGHFNLFAPSLAQRWGFNTGIMKINYTIDNALANDTKVIENVKTSPLEDLVKKDKYYIELNNYKTVQTNRTYSFYVQSLYRLTTESSKQQVYWHVHGELLVTKFNAVTTITNLQRDSGLYSVNKPAVVRAGISPTSTYSQTTLAGYFGNGITFDMNVAEKIHFFFQPTIGVTTNDIQINDNSTYLIGKTWKSFYLVRSYFSCELTKNSALIIGGDFRGIFPNNAPQYAAYFGLNLGVDAILKALK